MACVSACSRMHQRKYFDASATQHARQGLGADQFSFATAYSQISPLARWNSVGMQSLRSVAAQPLDRVSSLKLE